MRILLLHNRQLARGGADVVIDAETAALRARGHDVHHLFVDNHDVEALGPLRAGARAVWNRAATRELEAKLARDRPDVVHVHTPFPVMSPAVFRTAHRAGAATVATTHGYRYSCPLGTLRRDGHPCHECVGHRLKVAAVRHRCYKDRLAASLAVASGLSLHHLIGTFSGCVDRFVALTPFLRDVLVDDGIPAARIAVKPNFVADPGPPRAERGGYVLFAGRLTEEKGVRTLVDGWGRYAGPLRLKVAGDGPLRSLVDELAGRDPRVDAPGWQPAEAMVDLLGDAEALVFPSEWYEAMPLTVLQALAAGTPVVVSDLPNVGDLVEEDRTGTRFATGDPGALAAALVRVERGEAVPWRSRARARFESTYREGPVMDALERIYGEAVQARRGGAVPVEVGG